MKNPLPALGLLFSLAILPAQARPWPMPLPLPTPPPAGQLTTTPLPRIDWISRVQGNIETGRKMADSAQLVFDGDSITDLWQRDGQALWNERYGQYHAVDFGIAGDCTQHLLWRLSQGQADGFHPKLIALMIGTNNLGLGSSPREVAEGVKAIIEEYQRRCPKAVILLQAIFPRGEQPNDPFRQKIKDTNQLISKFAEDGHVIYLDFGDKFLNPDGVLPAEVMPDFLHPSARGYQIWADAIQPIIDQYLAK